MPLFLTGWLVSGNPSFLSIYRNRRRDAPSKTSEVLAETLSQTNVAQAWASRDLLWALAQDNATARPSAEGVTLCEQDLLEDAADARASCRPRAPAPQLPGAVVTPGLSGTFPASQPLTQSLSETRLSAHAKSGRTANFVPCPWQVAWRKVRVHAALQPLWTHRPRHSCNERSS